MRGAEASSFDVRVVHNLDSHGAATVTHMFKSGSLWFKKFLLAFVAGHEFKLGRRKFSPGSKFMDELTVAFCCVTKDELAEVIPGVRFCRAWMKCR